MYDEALSHSPDDSDEPRLIDHHRAVAERARRFTDGQRATAPEGTDVSTLVSLAGWVHDLGKANPEFQAYLRRDERNDRPNHAPLGAVAAFHAGLQRGLSPIDATIPLVAVARHHQRLPNAKTPYQYVDVPFLNKHLKPRHDEFVGNHLDSIEEVEACRDAARKSYAMAVDERGDWEAFTSALRDGDLAEQIDETIWDGSFIDSAVESEDYYAALLQTWSTLVLADKSHAADLDVSQVESPENPPGRCELESHVAGLGGDSTGREATLDTLRDEAFAEVNGPPCSDGEGRVHEFTESDRQIATLALPTGLGKTYTGLDAALTIRDALGSDSTVAYCLPYTSIIDQTAADVQDVFGVSPTDDQFTIDHYLADTVTELGDDEGEGREETDTESYTRDEKFLGESWQANLVVTTFVQLFESLLGPTNGASKKLPNLTDAVVVLDEPQALPLNDWDRIRDAVGLLTEKYGARVVLMTATQPRIFAPDDRFEPFSLVGDSSQYFQSDTERVSYRFDASVTDEGSPVGYEDAAADVLDGPETAATLAICNTIPSARELASEVAERADEFGCNHRDLNEIYDEYLSSEDEETSGASAGGEVPGEGASGETEAESSDGDEVADEVFEKTLDWVSDAEAPLVTLHLTTRHRPRDRERLLAVADRLTERDVRFVFVATQLVEAGVDVSFQRTYRDFAPLDSIVQAAGRCNRNFERDRGRVTVWQLAPVDGERPPSEAVYASDRRGSGLNLLGVTRRAIESVASLPSGGVAGTTVADDAVERYYELVEEATDVRDSEVKECATEDLNDYRLIDDRCLRSVEVVVCRTEDDLRLVEETESAFSQRDFETAFDNIERLADRTVSVPIYTSDRTPVQCQNPLDPRADKAVSTRWVDAREADDDSLFDPRDGVQNEESIEAYFL